MKIALQVLGALLICLALLLVVLRITGLDPKERRPGLWLSGELVTEPVTDWSFVKQYPNDRVQTRTWYLVPHSVTTNFILHDGQLYLTSTFAAGMPFPQGKTWTTNVMRDPRVRLKFGNQLFDRTVSLVTDPAKRARVLQLPQQTGRNGSTRYLFRVLPQ
jgi:hypothetical protein